MRPAMPYFNRNGDLAVKADSVSTWLRLMSVDKNATPDEHTFLTYLADGWDAGMADICQKAMDKRDRS